MRKVLLATTALVAMSVTAAQADISISGNYEWEYTTNDDWHKAGSDDGHINIKATNAADNGMTFTAVSIVTISSDNVTGADHAAGSGAVEGAIPSRLMATSVHSSLVITTTALASCYGRRSWQRNNDIETRRWPRF